MSCRALLRVKRRRSEDPFEALLISCQPKRAREAPQPSLSPWQRRSQQPPPPAARGAGGDYEGAEWSDRAPPLPLVRQVFHWAGSVGADASPGAQQAEDKLIEEIRSQGRPTRRVAGRKKQQPAASSSGSVEGSRSSVTAGSRSSVAGSSENTVVWNKQESRRKYWATRSSVRSHRSLVRSLAHWESEFSMSQNDLVLSHSGKG